MGAKRTQDKHLSGRKSGLGLHSHRSWGASSHWDFLKRCLLVVTGFWAMFGKASVCATSSSRSSTFKGSEGASEAQSRMGAVHIYRSSRFEQTMLC